LVSTISFLHFAVFSLEIISFSCFIIL
jgi:hypothetical protein